jgi:hypothetical protein
VKFSVEPPLKVSTPVVGALRSAKKRIPEVAPEVGALNVTVPPLLMDTVA